MKAKFSFVFAALLVPALAFAAEKNSAKVQIDEPVKVADTQLTPGQYRLTWDGTGSDVTVTFLKGNKTVATAPAKLVTASGNEQNAIETFTTADKTQLLKAVDLKNLTIQFQTPVSAAGN
jgi:hypothetical protein